MGDPIEPQDNQSDSSGNSLPTAKLKQPLEMSFSVNRFGETVSLSSTAQSLAGSKADAETPEVPKAIGRYEVRDVLGLGGFGAVYLGYDNQLDRKVAIKVPLLQSKDNIEDLFQQEARQLAQLTHPNIVTVYDVGIDNGACYIVSEYLDGQDLNQWMQGRKLTWQEIVQVVAPLADALASAHACSTIHRDVKPANILMTERPEGCMPVLVDFGLALSTSSLGSESARHGIIAGTPNYMSPEQARGEGHRIDGRTDIYALGVILYRMLSGQLPFSGPSVSDLLQSVIDDEPRPPRQFVRGIPRELEQMCLKAMAKQITDRYTTAGDLAEELRGLLKRHESDVKEAKVVAKAIDQPVTREATKILIADDHELTRFKLENDLKKWGHDVTVAEDGQQAWQLFQEDEFSIVITDWMMPNVDGLELVRRIRDSGRSDYVYIIMLTAKAEKHDIVTGMGAGADDFLGKPFNRDELQVRLRAGTRITKLNHELNETNRRLRNSQQAAAQIQRSFLPMSIPAIDGFQFAWDHHPCVELGGDMLNIVPLDHGHFALYVLDVSGEGVPASLLATNLSRVMAPPSDPNSLLVERSNDQSGFRILEPVEIAKRLNQHFGGDREARQFFTLAYGVVDIQAREFCFTSAGHPPLLHQPPQASPAMLDMSGFPIGMAPESEEFSQQTVPLKSGERLFIYSDGLTDSMNNQGEVFGAARLLNSATEHNHLPLAETVKALMNDVSHWRGKAESNDDTSILAVGVS